VSVLETIFSYWLGKSLFFGGFYCARWMVWAMSPVWAVIAGIGALCGFLFGR